MNPLAEEAEYLDYRAGLRSGGMRSGKHQTREIGAGGDVRSIRPFWQLPDAQRIDIRRSIIDPFGEVMVRQTDRKSSITLAIALDVSRSMQPQLSSPLGATAARLVRAAARSALRAGDAFAFLAFDETIRDDLSLPPTRSRAAIRQIDQTLRGIAATGRSASGLGRLAAALPRRQCLILLISDFLIPRASIQSALRDLSAHRVVPVVLRADSIESLPRYGLVRLQDAESGGTRLLCMRPALHAELSRAERRRRAALHALFDENGCSDFDAAGHIDIKALSEHLMSL